MKTSNKIIIFTGAVPFIIALIMIFSLRNIMSEEADPALLNSEEINAEQINSEKRSFDFRDFENISAEGVWDINLLYDDNFNVELLAPESMMSKITIDKKGRTLKLLSKKNSYSIFSINKRPRINISLPVISGLDIDGVAAVKYVNFKNIKTSVEMDGVLSISGKNSTIDQFFLKGDGVLYVAMNDLPVTNAHINHNGIYMINMLMNGGELKGRLDGIGIMIAPGDIRENSIKVDGLGSLTID
ncbi:GIN domain-containing protein [Thermodesulfobacteriota bacterium]